MRSSRVLLVVALVWSVVPVRASADGGGALAGRKAVDDGPLVAERFEHDLSPRPHRVGSSYHLLGHELFCERGTMRALLFDERDGTRFERRLPCPPLVHDPMRTGPYDLRLVWYAPESDRLGWFYTRRVSVNPYDPDTDHQRWSDHGLYDKVDEAYYVEQEIASGQLGPASVIYRVTGSQENATVALASDDHTLDVCHTSWQGNNRPSVTHVVRFDRRTGLASTLIEQRSASASLDCHWNSSHTWLALTGWISRFETEYHPGTAVFFEPATRRRFETRTPGAIGVVAFDPRAAVAYLGSNAHGEIARVDLGRRRVTHRRRGFGVVANVAFDPEGSGDLIVFPSYEDYVVTSSTLERRRRHAYEPMLGTAAPMPWPDTVSVSRDGRRLLYVTYNKGAILTWRSRESRP